MRPNKLRELLKANKPTLSTHIHTTWPSVVEAIGHTGLYDYVEFVGEYGPFDLHDLDNLARAGGHLQHVDAAQGRPGAAGLPRAAGDRVRLPQHPVRRLSLRRRRAGVRAHRARGDPGGRRNLRRGHPSVHLHGLWRHQGVRPGPARHRRGHHDREAGDGRHARGRPVRQRCRHGAVGRLRLLDGHRTTPASAIRPSYAWWSAACSKRPSRWACRPAPRSPPRIRRSTSSTWASGTSPSAPTSPSCTSGGSPRVRTCARRSAAADSRR